MAFRLFADAAVVLHLAFVLFVLAGGLLVVRWPRVAWAQTMAISSDGGASCGVMLNRLDRADLRLMHGVEKVRICLIFMSPLCREFRQRTTKFTS